jgi:hypothetical protein
MSLTRHNALDREAKLYRKFPLTSTLEPLILILILLKVFGIL